MGGHASFCVAGCTASSTSVNYVRDVHRTGVAGRERFRDGSEVAPKDRKSNKNVEIRGTKDALIVFRNVLLDKTQPMGKR
eukprot:scaffold1071_cov328-Pavlova_lutheri.AAC.14